MPLKSYLDNPDVVPYLSGEEIRYMTQEKFWRDAGVPVDCPKCGSTATDIFYDSHDGGIPSIFYCRWDNEMWVDKAVGVSEDRIIEVRVQLGLERDSRSTYERALDSLRHR
jgi:hypothetical protein